MGAVLPFPLYIYYLVLSGKASPEMLDFLTDY